MTSVTLSIRVVATREPHHIDGFGDLHCLRCGEPLDLHQPSPELPMRFLATCPACSAWSLVGCRENEGDAFIFLLPDDPEILRTYEAAGGT